MDYEEAGLLDGLEGAEREARIELLRRLQGDGIGVEELRAAAAENRLALLPVERRLGGLYTARDVEARAGVPAAVLLRIRRLLGLPEAGGEDHVFSAEDIEAARATRVFLEAGFDLDALAELTRVLGEGMARLAAAVTATFAQTFLRPGDTELDVADRFDRLAEQLTPFLSPALVAAFNAHLRDAVHRGMIDRDALAAGQPPGAVELAVCFADLVGFTRLGGELEVQELGSVAGGLARLAAEVAEPPVRLIKTIGDAAMLVSTEPAPLVEAALRLVAAVEEADLPTLRAGIALGPAAQRAGDFYGHSVNLASRVTGVARPGSVLCTPEVREAAPDRFAWSYAGRFKLKGIGEPVALHRAHMLGDDGEAEEAPPREKRREERRRRRDAR